MSIIKQLQEKYGGKRKHKPFTTRWMRSDYKMFATYTPPDGINKLKLGEIPTVLLVTGTENGTEKFYPETT